MRRAPSGTSSRRPGLPSLRSARWLGCLRSRAGTSRSGCSAPAYSSDVGDELGRLVVVLSLWAVVAVGVSVTFPLVFVAGKGRLLPLIAVGAVGLQLGVAWAGQTLFGLDGLALALAVTTAAVLDGVARPAAELSARRRRGLVLAALTVARRHGDRVRRAGAAASAVPAAAVGLCVYAALVAVVRPAGLRDAWRYLRALA